MTNATPVKYPLAILETSVNLEVVEVAEPAKEGTTPFIVITLYSSAAPQGIPFTLKVDLAQDVAKGLEGLVRSIKEKNV